MLKNHWRLISRLARAGDNLLIGVAFVITYNFRDNILHFLTSFEFSVVESVTSLAPIDTYVVILGLSLPLYNAFLSVFGAYRSMRFQSYIQPLRFSGLASILVFLSIGSLLYMLKLDLSRSFVGIFCTITTLLIYTERVIILLLLRFFRIRGKNFRNLLIVGTGEQARSAYEEIILQPELGIRVVGFVELSNTEMMATAQVANSLHQEVAEQLTVPGVTRGELHLTEVPAKIVATPDTFEKALKRFAIDEVIFTDVVREYAQIREMAQIASEEGIRVTLAADLFSLKMINSEITYFGDLPLIQYDSSPGGGDSTELVVKRATDVIVSATSLVLLFPALIVTAILIKLDSPGPIFFQQKRMGLNGRKFTLYKFRSMVQDAERKRRGLESQNEMTGPVFKIANDPRITRLGSFLRKHSIDELPQLWNVLRGDMSLVGPRPPIPKEVSLYERKHRRRLSMRPGLTCTWQVSGRNEIPDFEQWAKLDLEYIDNWSLRNDFKLLLKTIPAVFFGRGAR